MWKKKKIRKENERRSALKDVAEKEEDEVKENTINKADTLNIQQSIPTNNEPKISNTSIAQNSRQIISVVSTGGSTAELVLWQKIVMENGMNMIVCLQGLEKME